LAIAEAVDDDAAGLDGDAGHARIGEDREIGTAHANGSHRRVEAELVPGSFCGLTGDMARHAVVQRVFDARLPRLRGIEPPQVDMQFGGGAHDKQATIAQSNVDVAVGLRLDAIAFQQLHPLGNGAADAIRSNPLRTAGNEHYLPAHVRRGGSLRMDGRGHRG
jgi:hypothetical protein